MNWIDLDDVYCAWTGELEPLAKAIESGKTLTEEAAEFLVLYLRGEVKWPRGNRRVYSQIARDLNLAFVLSITCSSKGQSMERAINDYCSETGANYETVRSALKRAREFDGILHPKKTITAW